MVNFKCANCAGEMAVSRIGDLKCPYCGSRQFFNDHELQEYKMFRKRILEYLSAAADDESAEGYLECLWSDYETEVLTDKNGTDITIQYIYKSIEEGISMYAARRNVIYIFPKDKSQMADMAVRQLSEVTFPQADMKGLRRSFPDFAGKYELADERVMLVYSKDENLHPVAMFGTLPAKHVEWIISRLENIACVLAFCDKCHGGITREAVYINTKTHEAALYGNWHKAGEQINGAKQDIKDIRMVATALLGEKYGDAPHPLIEFLESKPRENAYEDFEMWDKVIEEELGGRHFTKFIM